MIGMISRLVLGLPEVSAKRETRGRIDPASALSGRGRLLDIFVIHSLIALSVRIRQLLRVVVIDTLPLLNF